MNIKSLLIIILLSQGISFGSQSIELRINIQTPKFGNNYLPQWSTGRSITIESGFNFSPGINLGGLISYLKFPLNSDQLNVVDAEVYSTEAEYIKIAALIKVDIFHSFNFAKIMSPYSLIGGGVMRQDYEVKGYSWGGEYIDSRKNWLNYFFVGFGIDLFQYRQISYFIDYRYEQEYDYNYSRYDRPLRFGYLSAGLQMTL